MPWASDIVSYNSSSPKVNRISRILIESDIVSYNSNRILQTFIESDIVSYNSNRISRILIKTDIVSYESQFTFGEQDIANSIECPCPSGWASDIVSYISRSLRAVRSTHAKR